MMDTTHARKSKAGKRKIAGLALLTMLALVGCGGGGNSGSGGSKTLAGTLLGLTSEPLVGYKVVYDAGAPAAQTTTTDVQGQYKFVLSPAAITGSDALSFYDAAGHLVDTQAVSLATAGSTVTLTTVAPPAPPPGV